jgi:hypothetical protein
VELTPEEIFAGRVFRKQCQNELSLLFSKDTSTSVFSVPVTVAYFRHKCSHQGDKSFALEMKESYTLSPEYFVDPETLRVYVESTPGMVSVRAGRFGWITKHGHCRSCGVSARCTQGRLVNTDDRVPLDARKSSRIRGV